MQLDYSSPEFESKYTYTGSDLGYRWSPDSTAFRLWAPTAEQVSVRLYHQGTPWVDDCMETFPMTRDQNGTWFLRLEGDWNGKYYTYLVTNKGNTCEVCDPYARTTGVNGVRSMILNLASTNPPDWEYDRDPNADLVFTDSVIYELHIRDLSVQSQSGITHKGKLLGLCETGTHNRSGQATGLDHIKNLGITHLHLLPIYDFGSIDETDPRPQYNWGYDPVNYNVPEGSYSTDPFHGEVRVAELKRMIQSLHRSGISVILDVVYNHVYHTNEFSINQIVPGYFSRANTRGRLSNGSGCGNDTASERSMVRKYIVDSVNYWADEYHVDGFRFDLVGLIDTDTINEIMNSVHTHHPNVKFYGEGWDIPTGITKTGISLTIQRNAASVPGFAFFNDSIRDAVRGSVFHTQDPGFVSGSIYCADRIRSCFMARPGWTEEPGQIINYVSCHDNHTLRDRIAAVFPDTDPDDLARRCRLAAAINILSQGVPFFQAGEEMLRSKPNHSGGYYSNTYRSPDRTNSLKWDRLKNPLVQVSVQYYSGLIRIKKSYPEFRLTTPLSIRSCIADIQDPDPRSAAFLIHGKIRRFFVGFNANESGKHYSLPAGLWNILVLDQSAGTQTIGTAEGQILCPPLSCVVLIQEKAS